MAVKPEGMDTSGMGPHPREGKEDPPHCPPGECVPAIHGGPSSRQQEARISELEGTVKIQQADLKKRVEHEKIQARAIEKLHARARQKQINIDKFLKEAEFLRGERGEMRKKAEAYDLYFSPFIDRGQAIVSDRSVGKGLFEAALDELEATRANMETAEGMLGVLPFPNFISIEIHHVAMRDRDAYLERWRKSDEKLKDHITRYRQQVEVSKYLNELLQRERQGHLALHGELLTRLQTITTMLIHGDANGKYPTPSPEAQAELIRRIVEAGKGIKAALKGEEIVDQLKNFPDGPPPDYEARMWGWHARQWSITRDDILGVTPPKEGPEPERKSEFQVYIEGWMIGADARMRAVENYLGLREPPEGRLDQSPKYKGGEDPESVRKAGQVKKRICGDCAHLKRGGDYGDTDAELCLEKNGLRCRGNEGCGSWTPRAKEADDGPKEKPN